METTTFETAYIVIALIFGGLLLLCALVVISIIVALKYLEKHGQ